MGSQANTGSVPVNGYGQQVSVLTPVSAWAVLGLLSTVFSLSVFGQWLFSAEFAAVPITAMDALPEHGLLKIRIVEAISTAVALSALYFYLFRPWFQRRELTIEGLLLVGALLTYVMDTSINYYGYFMAWNKHALNWGTWGNFFPGHTGPSNYAEALLWGPPMYIYFGVALATLQSAVIRLLRNRFNLSFAVALIASYPTVFLFDLVAESIIVRQQAYAWPNTIGALTLWKGELYQFPLYESFLVGIYASMYTCLMHSARHDGITFIERGMERFSGLSRHVVRLMAATGFAMLCTFIYFFSFGVFSLFADSTIVLPSYLMYVQ